MSVAFVAGATGYTGRELVRVLREAGARTIAHVRPGSSRLAEWRERFTALGAQIDTTPWEEAALTETLTALAPTQVFALLGTTRHRAKGEGRSARDAYEQVDYGLTVLLLRASLACGLRPRFVYLSAAGVKQGTSNPYMAARARVEAELQAADLPWTIARPSFITGPGRDDSRPGERIGAAVGDAALSVLGLLGGRGVRARYRSTTPHVLATALARLATDPAAAGQIAEGDRLR